MSIGAARSSTSRLDRARLRPKAPEARTEKVRAEARTKTAEAPRDEAPAVRPTARSRELARTTRALDDRRLRAHLEGGRDQTSRLGAANPVSFSAEGNAFVVRRGAPPAQDDLALPDKWGDRPASLEDVRDPDYVDNDGTEAQQEAARLQVEGRAEAEAIALEGLEAEQRDQYDAVAQTTEADPLAREALQDMLLDGDFEGEDGAQLLDELHGLTEDELAEGIDREELVSDLVQELADPAAIAQRGKGTCVATSSEIYLAQHQPAEYARLIRGLASPEGRVDLANGDQIQREGGTIDDGSGRSITQRLLAPALMEYANGNENYVNGEDRNKWWVFDRGSGLNGGEAERLLEAMTGGDFRRETAGKNAAERAALAEEILDVANAGDVVSVSLQWGDDSGHRVLVTGGDDDWVYITNPWGVEQRMSREDFDLRVKDGIFSE